MIGSAESPFIWDASPSTMAHLGSHPPCSASLTRDWTMSPAWRGASRATSSISRAVDVPLGEVGVLGPVPSTGGPGRRRRRTAPLSSLTTLGIEQRVVEGGVEGPLLGRRAARRRGSDRAGRSTGCVAVDSTLAERPTRVLDPQIVGGVGHAHERDAHLHQDHRVGRGVEGDVGTAGRPRHEVAPGRDRRPVPAPGRGEGPVEPGGEVQRVVGAGPTELAAGRPDR